MGKVLGTVLDKVSRPKHNKLGDFKRGLIFDTVSGTVLDSFSASFVGHGFGQHLWQTTDFLGQHFEHSFGHHFGRGFERFWLRVGGFLGQTFGGFWPQFWGVLMMQKSARSFLR